MFPFEEVMILALISFSPQHSGQPFSVGVSRPYGRLEPLRQAELIVCTFPTAARQHRAICAMAKPLEMYQTTRRVSGMAMSPLRRLTTMKVFPKASRRVLPCGALGQVAQSQVAQSQVT